ncbi:hypothetical protein [Novosphingobium terrae]|uniref:hypothetical protein n=1 Tax=Novosphingobium terrae TaxID=2726189 RepID=UPI001981549D|nr:hypothetical protein [Novosphingobium terrae]
MTVMNEFQEGWFSEHLAAAGEPSLAKLAETAPASGRAVVRFTWLPSFDHPVTVRLEWVPSGAMHLTARMLSGAGGYAPGVVKQKVDRDLTEAEKATMNKLFASLLLWRQPAALCDLGSDGAEWIFDGADSAGYHFVKRWSPNNGPVKEAGMAMLKLTGWHFKDIY